MKKTDRHTEARRAPLHDGAEVAGTACEWGEMLAGFLVNDNLNHERGCGNR